MKTASRILNIVISSLVSLVGFAFVVIEGYLLFSGDFLLFENEFVAFLQIFLRLTIAVGTVTFGVVSIVKKERSFLFESLVMFLCICIMSHFLTNGFGLYFMLLAALNTLTKLFYNKYLSK